MVEVTEVDKNCIPAHILGAIPKVWHKAIYTASATHREASAKAERDRLRNLPDDVAMKAHGQLPECYEHADLADIRVIATALADALEKQND